MKTIPTLIMVVGLPGSGKSYFLEQNFGGKIPIHSSDTIRRELLGSEESQDNNSLVFETLHNRVKEDLKNGISCCYDATNMVAKKRKAFLQEIKGIQCVKNCYIVATPIELCVQNDKGRDRKVGVEVIESMRERFNLPTIREGWDSVKLIYNFNSVGFYNSQEILSRLMGIEQHNPHHELTIGEHCLLCQKNVLADPEFKKLNKEQQDSLRIAALYHDIGKEFTATFQNKKGEVSDICHFYSHENVGAYNSLFLDCFDYGDSVSMILQVADLINLHMRLYSNPDSEKYKAKLQRQIGDELYNMLTILHNADKNAK